MSGFLGQALFGKNGKVRIFWTSPVWQKPKSPDFKRTTVLRVVSSADFDCRIYGSYTKQTLK